MGILTGAASRRGAPARAGQPHDPGRGLPGLAAFLLVAALAVFADLAEDLAYAEPVLRLDQRFADLLHERATPVLTSVMEVVSDVGSSRVIALVAVVAICLLLWRRDPQDAVLVAIVVVGAALLDRLLKVEFERPRPVFDVPLDSATGFSFPSAHAMSSTALYGVLAYVASRRLRARRAQVVCFAAAAVLIAAVSFSRLYLGLHFLSDVLAGIAAGLAWLMLCLLAAPLVRSLLERGSQRLSQP